MFASRGCGLCFVFNVRVLVLKYTTLRLALHCALESNPIHLLLKDVVLVTEARGFCDIKAFPDFCSPNCCVNCPGGIRLCFSKARLVAHLVQMSVEWLWRLVGDVSFSLGLALSFSVSASCFSALSLSLLPPIIFPQSARPCRLFDTPAPIYNDPLIHDCHPQEV